MKTLKYTTLVLIGTYALSLAAAVYGQRPALNEIESTQLNLMPVPASVQIQTGRLPITGSFNVAVKNYTDDRLRGGIARMLTRLAGRTVLTLPAELAADEGT